MRILPAQSNTKVMSNAALAAAAAASADREWVPSTQCAPPPVLL